MGAAFWAMIGTGALTSLEQIGKVVTLAENYQPDAKNSAIYDKQFEIYKRLYAAVRPCFKAVSDFEKELDKKGHND